MPPFDSLKLFDKIDLKMVVIEIKMRDTTTFRMSIVEEVDEVIIPFEIADATFFETVFS